MSEKQTNLVNKFNLAINTLVDHIVEHYGDTSARAAQCIVANIIRFKPNEPISFFLLNIFSNDAYRHNILIQNDDFLIKLLLNKRLIMRHFTKSLQHLCTPRLSLVVS